MQTAKHAICVACLLVAFSSVGCVAPARTGEPTIQTLASTDGPQFDRLWMAGQDVLREHRFRLDRIDRRAGVISTLPATSKHIFEFWRHDVETAHDLWEATLRTVQRQVTIDLTNRDDSGATTLGVTVRRQRYARAERQFNNSIAAYRMFGNALPAEATGRSIDAGDEYWIDAGRDIALERYLLQKIVARADGR